MVLDKKKKLVSKAVGVGAGLIGASVVVSALPQSAVTSNIGAGVQNVSNIAPALGTIAGAGIGITLIKQLENVALEGTKKKRRK